MATRGRDPTVLLGSRSVAELEAEVAKLRKELAVEHMEKDVLKNRPLAPNRRLLELKLWTSTLEPRRDRGHKLLGEMNPVKKPGPREAAGTPVAAPARDPV